METLYAAERVEPREEMLTLSGHFGEHYAGVWFLSNGQRIDGFRSTAYYTRGTEWRQNCRRQQLQGVGARVVPSQCPSYTGRRLGETSNAASRARPRSRSRGLCRSFGGAKLIGPMLIGLGLPIEVAPLRSSPSDILNLASIAAYSSEVIDYKS